MQSVLSVLVDHGMTGVAAALIANDHVVVPLAPEAFADGVAALARDRARREAIGSRGRRLVDEKYNFGVFRAGLAKVHGAVSGRTDASR